MEPPVKQQYEYAVGWRKLLEFSHVNLNNDLNHVSITDNEKNFNFKTFNWKLKLVYHLEFYQKNTFSFKDNRERNVIVNDERYRTIIRNFFFCPNWSSWTGLTYGFIKTMSHATAHRAMNVNIKRMNLMSSIFLDIALWIGRQDHAIWHLWIISCQVM